MGRQIKMLILALTGECNFACDYCYAHEQPPQVIAFETAVKAIDLAAQSKQSFVLQFTGGEPLLAFPVLKKIAAYVSDKKIPALMQIQTNASLVDQEKAAFLKKAKIGVGISFDGWPQQNDFFRRLPSGGGTSPLILQGVEALAAAKVEVGITCVVTKKNAAGLAGIVDMAYYLGNVRKIGFDLLRAQGRGAALTAAEPQELAKGLQLAIARVRVLQGYTGRKISFSHTMRVESLAKQEMTGFAHCHAMNGEAAYIDPQGNIYACASLAGMEQFFIGHVDTGIDASRQREISDLIQTQMSFCPQCSSFALCGGACFARWYGAGKKDQPYEGECVLKNTFIQEYKTRQ
ncbi:MAG: radical SAM protein [Sporomusaceae bacterium]|nr:radical SAM protein [Sporomusaceae bacterium]